ERAIALRQGCIVGDDPPAELFRQPDLLVGASLRLPPVMALSQGLGRYGVVGDVLTVDAFCRAYEGLFRARWQRPAGSAPTGEDRAGRDGRGQT
ncbi:MAG: hypothetical protein ACP5JJ_17065, partial [Anaerolineae bacterium]